MIESILQESPRHHTHQFNIHSGTVALFGEVLVDVFPDRHVLGGAPFNVARHLQAFGLHPLLITRTGNDVLRDELMATMIKLGMDTRGVQSDPLHPTGQVLVHMDNGGHYFEIIPRQAYDYIHASITRMMALAVQPELIYFGTLAQRHLISRQALGSLFKSVKAPRMLDINLREPWYDAQTLRRSLIQTDILKLNNEELHRVAQLLNLEETDEYAQAASLMSEFDLSKVLVTQGQAGAWLLDADGRVASAPAGPSIRIEDTIGAGDGFAAVFILGMFKNWSAEQVLLRADSFARTLCGIRGAIPYDDTFYEPFRKAWNLDTGDLS